MGDTLNIKTSHWSRSETAKNKVKSALAEMLTTGEKISFYSVAKKANVSPNYLYTTSEFRKAIEQLRERNTPPKLDKEQSEKLDSFLIELENNDLKLENKLLKSEIEDMKKEIQRLKKYIDVLEKEGKHSSSTNSFSDTIHIPF